MTVIKPDEQDGENEEVAAVDTYSVLLKKSKKYLRELSVVVVGIAITFGISSWISYRNNKKDFNLYLNTIMLELKTNVEQIEYEINVLDESVSYTLYLSSHSKESLNSDTIQKYEHAINRHRNVKFKRNAFEMFKSSGNMSLLSNKELLLSIWEAYDQIEDFQSEFQTYYQYKKDKFTQEYELQMREKKTAILMYDFFITEYPVNLQQRCKRNLKTLKEIVSKLEEEMRI